MTRPEATTRPRAGIDPVTVLTRLLFVVAFTVLVVRGVWYLSSAGEPSHLISGLLAVGYLVWLSVEIPVTFRKPAQPAAEIRTLAVYACARLTLVVVAMVPAAPWSRFSWWMIPPIVLFVAGIALRLTAIRALGALYTHHVLRRDRHPIVTGGPYRLVRHPAYAGMLLANLGFVLYFLSPVSVLALLALLGGLIWRIRTEERVLWSAPGYPEFATGRARLVPGVW
ncbi:isoprenylcysteine carboxylmethyltransferase family protein [Micromonospora sp. NPDC023644]|uniref:methyltransferase family protein n=1 Tax=Micromonospora sp. NPDC023644 TaxID=3154321 RepID=UPI0033C89C55